MAKKTLRNLLVAGALATGLSAGNAYAQQAPRQIVSTDTKDLLRVDASGTTERRTPKRKAEENGISLNINYGAGTNKESGLRYAGIDLQSGNWIFGLTGGVGKEMTLEEVNQTIDGWEFYGKETIERKATGASVGYQLNLPKGFTLDFRLGTMHFNYKDLVEESIRSGDAVLGSSRYSIDGSETVPEAGLEFGWKAGNGWGVNLGFNYSKLPTWEEIQKLPGLENINEELSKKLMDKTRASFGLTIPLGGRK
ncbi:MAG: hypothetical protein AABX28_02395 [Nanoarchaeota archaeon]